MVADVGNSLDHRTRAAMLRVVHERKWIGSNERLTNATKLPTGFAAYTPKLQPPNAKVGLGEQKCQVICASYERLVTGMRCLV